MLRACKEIAPVSVKAKCLLMQAIKNEYVCVYTCLSSSAKSAVDNYLYVYVIEAILEVVTRSAPRDVCVFVHAKSKVGIGVCK